MKQIHLLGKLVGLLLGLGLFLTLTPAHATAAPAKQGGIVTTEMRAALTTYWTDNGVPEQTQKKLLAALDRGDGMDSLRGGTPSSTREIRAGNTVKTVSVYKDGSILVTTSQVPQPATTPSDPGQVTTQAAVVDRCNYSDTHYSRVATACRADANWGLYGLNFLFDFEAYQGAVPTITRYYSDSEWAVVPASVDSARFSVMNQNNVRLYVNVHTPFFSSSIFLGAIVNGTTPTAYTG